MEGIMEVMRKWKKMSKRRCFPPASARRIYPRFKTRLNDSRWFVVGRTPSTGFPSASAALRRPAKDQLAHSVGGSQHSSRYSRYLSTATDDGFVSEKAASLLWWLHSCARSAIASLWIVVSSRLRGHSISLMPVDPFG